MDTNEHPKEQSAKRQILCIEDEYFIGELYARALERGGYSMNLIADGIEGLKEAQTNKYDIILLDLMIPNLTGIEILRDLRDKQKTPVLKSKIIITTNLDQRDDVRADIEKQADAYLVKAEMTPNELVEFLDNIR